MGLYLQWHILCLTVQSVVLCLTVQMTKNLIRRGYTKNTLPISPAFPLPAHKFK